MVINVEDTEMHRKLHIINVYLTTDDIGWINLGNGKMKQEYVILDNSNAIKIKIEKDKRQ